MTSDAVGRTELSVIIPVLNEAENIAPLLARLVPILNRCVASYEIVFVQRVDRSDDSALRRALTQRFYRIFGSVGETRLPEGAGDFRLLDAQAVAGRRGVGGPARVHKSR